MPREKDPFWKYVTFLNENNSKWRCNFCGQEHGGGATRIKAHLAGIARFGIKGCERVDDDVKAEARDVLMPKKLDSSDQGVPEERIQGNVRAASTSTSDPPNVEGGTNLQFPQGVPSLTPQTRGRMEEMLQEERDLPLNGATSYYSESPLPNSLFPGELLTSFIESLDLETLNAQQNPSAPLTSQEPLLLDNTLQNKSQGSILPGPIALDTQLSNIPTTNTSQDSSQPLQSDGQCGYGTGLSPPRTSIDVEPPDPSQPFNEPLIVKPLNSPLQIPKDIINTMGPSTSKGMSKGAPTGASSFQYDQTTVPHSNESRPSCNEECRTETSSFPLRESRDIYPLTATRVDLQVLEGEANMAGPSPSQALVPPQRQSVPHQSINLKTSHQIPTMPSSSWKNHLVTCHPVALMDMDPCIPSSSQTPNHAPQPSQIPPCGASLIGPSSLPELSMNEGVPMTCHPNIGNNFEENGALKRKLELLYRREAGIRAELKFAEPFFLKKPRMEIANLLAIAEKCRNDCAEATSEEVEILMREEEDSRRQGKGLFEARETKFSKFLERKMVGEVFQKNTTKILEYLVGNQVSRLGIYGMGGVGKTTIMKHIHNRLLEKANYGNMLWITVSRDFNTKKLQDDIWEALKLGLLQEKDVSKRAAILSNCLTKRGKSTIILDDVWECFDLEEVGIPIRVDGFKLVLTTRSFGVCCQMQCQEKIKIEPLFQKEAETLFLEELGSEVALDLEIKAVMKSIVKEFAGLPLGVITMARSMRGVTDVFEWKDCLVKLKQSSKGQPDMEKEVLMKLKFSYTSLDNHEVQQCFLSCALYPEGKNIDKFELIELFIDQGLIGGLDTREEQYDRGLTILNILENVCLLEDHEMEMRMHDLLRDMALHIMSATAIVKAGKGLRIPDEEHWTDALEKVSLMENDIREIPWNMLPNCPNLSAFLLNYCLWKDVVIPNSFFKKFCGLKVLNLSGYDLRELPHSISDLVNLRVLLLRNCRNLRHIPYLGKLRSLRKLDVCGCGHLEALEGLEMLVNLRYLALTGTRIERLPEGTLGGLLKLQYLKVHAVNVEDIAKLWALETLKCDFKDGNDFNKCVRVIKQSNTRSYELVMEQVESSFYRLLNNDPRFQKWERIVTIDGWSHAIVSVGGESSGISISIPEDVQILIGRGCDGTTNLSDMGLLENLEDLNIGEWKNLQVLCGGQDEKVINIHDSCTPTPTRFHFPSLRVLEIWECPKLKYLFGHGSKFYLPHLIRIEICSCKEIVGIIAAVTAPPPRSPPAFPSLTRISIANCDKMKKVVESEWLPHFPNLRDITVFDCENMEEIIGGPPPDMLVEEISLESLWVKNCDNIRKLIPHELMIHLRKLTYISVAYCKGMVEMISAAGQSQGGSIMTPVNNISSPFQSSISLPKLEHLVLFDVPQLKSICEVPITCDSMEFIQVYKCPELNKIPLKLQLRDIEDLPYITVLDEEKWKTLTWDQPDAQAILQSHLLFSDRSCVLEGKRSH